jgi:acetyltransferase-like isoleucine patch superfamily enzyme
MMGRRSRKVVNAIRRRIPFTSLTPLLPAGLEIGRHTYGPIDYDTTFPMLTDGARTVVGSYCSIHAEARILGGGEHVITRASTYPLKARLFDRARSTATDAIDTGPTVVGNDVYIGLGAIVLSGVRIGDGAVVGAGAVVKKSVPPYAVVVGNPAHVAHYRFELQTRERLLALRWWEWDDRDIERALPWFLGDVESFLDHMEREHTRST